jgi:hypothetical protein
MTTSEYEQVREGLLIEGLIDAIYLGEIHTAFLGQDAAHRPPIPHVQQQTMRMIRELVSDGYFVLGVPTRHGGFVTSDLPLDVAMAEIEDAYVKHYEDSHDWRYAAWLYQTDSGKKLALELYHADDTDDSAEQP